MSNERKNLLAVAVLLVVLLIATLALSLLLPSQPQEEQEQEDQQQEQQVPEQPEDEAASDHADEMADLLEQDTPDQEASPDKEQVVQITMPMMEDGQPVEGQGVDISVELPGDWILDTEYSPGTMFHYPDGTVAVEGFYAYSYNENATLWTNARAWKRSNYLSSDVISQGGTDIMLSIYGLSEDATETSPYAYVYAIPHRDIIYFVEFQASGTDNEEAKAEQLEILQNIVFLGN